MTNPVFPLGTELTDKVALNDLDAAGGVLQWQNHEESPVLVTRLVIDITSASTDDAACDFGSAADSTSSSSNLIDQLNTHAVGIFDNIQNGTKTYVKRDPGQWITGTKSPGCRNSVADLAGFAYITYLIIP